TRDVVASAADAMNEVAQTAASTTKKAAETAANVTTQVTESADAVAGQVTEATARTAKKALRVVDAGAGAAKSAGEAAIEGARQMTEVGARQAETVVLAARDTTSAASRAVQPALRGLTALSGMPVASLTMVSDVGQVWSDLVKENLETGARASREIVRLSNPQEIAVVQSRFAVEVLQSWMNAGTRMMQISLRASDTLRSAAQRADAEGKNAASAGS
ncbi:MAG TPA: phasin family protein, partial [Burkholderiales bacterium]|nr:phasin family protein [Burkholderiales bacterium]